LSATRQQVRGVPRRSNGTWRTSVIAAPSAWRHACRFVRHHFGDHSSAASAKLPSRSRTNAHRTTYQCELSSSAFRPSGRWSGRRWGRNLLGSF
jgi:hypothetical protein